MKRLNPTALSIISLVLVLFLTSAIQRTKWKKYKNKDYGFSIKFPKDHIIEEDVDHDGQTLSMQYFNDETNELYYVSVYESKDFIAIEGVDNIAIKTFAEEVDGALLSSKELKNGRKEAIIGLDENTFIFYQVEIHDDALYQIISMHHSSNKNDHLEDYFDSFEILD